MQILEKRSDLEKNINADGGIFAGETKFDRYETFYNSEGSKNKMVPLICEQLSCLRTHLSKVLPSENNVSFLSRTFLFYKIGIVAHIINILT